MRQVEHFTLPLGIGVYTFSFTLLGEGRGRGTRLGGGASCDQIVTHDLFRPDDDVHYKDKIPVGRRFARAALHLAYHRDIPYSGPICREARVEGRHIRLLFDHLCGGLEARGGPLGGFCIAGADRQWAWADARIDGDTVIVSSSPVAEPTAVRYAWSKYPCGANIINKASLPTPTFRTDTWPLTSQGTLVIEKD